MRSPREVKTLLDSVATSSDYNLTEIHPSLADTPEAVSDLASELPGGGQDDGVDAIWIHCQCLENGNGEGERLSLTSLGNTHTVPSSEDWGDTVSLNWAGARNSEA